MRSELDIQNPERAEMEMNLLFFYKTLERILQDQNEEYFNLKDRQPIDACKKEAQEIIRDMTANIFNR